MSAFNHRLFRAVNVNTDSWVGRCSRLTHAGKCDKPVEFLAQYDYVTGQRGRVSTSDRWLCEQHAQMFANGHKLTWSELKGEVDQAKYFGRRQEAFSQIITPRTAAEFSLIVPKTQKARAA